MKSLLIALCVLVTSLGLSAQDQLGLRLDNYAGINGSLLNPAAAVAGPLNWDVNLIGFGQFFENNYIHIQNAGLLRLAGYDASDQFYFQRDLQGENMPTPRATDFIYDYASGTRQRFGITTSDLLGPSFFVRLGQNTSVGVITRARLHGSAFGIDSDLSFYPYDARPFDEFFALDPIHAGAAAWSEIGLNLGQNLFLGDGTLSIGVTAKWLQGYEGMYFNSLNTVEYAKQPEHVINGRDIDLYMGYTDGWTNDDFSLQAQGSGWGLDLGFSYAAFAENGGYRWKLGLSLLDLGQLNFHTNAQEYHLVNPELADLDGDDYQDYREPQQMDDLVDQFANDVVDNPEEARVAENFHLALPTKLSLQFDYALLPSVYLNATLIGGLPIGENRMESGDLIAFTPRYEHRWFTASLPISVYEWQQFRVGAAARLGFVTLGTDKLAGIFGSKQFTGADFYVALKLTPLWNKKERKQKAKKNRSRGGREMPCYKW